ERALGQRRQVLVVVTEEPLGVGFLILPEAPLAPGVIDVAMVLYADRRADAPLGRERGRNGREVQAPERKTLSFGVPEEPERPLVGGVTDVARHHAMPLEAVGARCQSLGRDESSQRSCV